MPDCSSLGTACRRGKTSTRMAGPSSWRCCKRLQMRMAPSVGLPLRCRSLGHIHASRWETTTGRCLFSQTYPICSTRMLERATQRSCRRCCALSTAQMAARGPRRSRACPPKPRPAASVPAVGAAQVLAWLVPARFPIFVIIVVLHSSSPLFFSSLRLSALHSRTPTTVERQRTPGVDPSTEPG